LARYQSVNVVDSPELRDLLTFISYEVTDAMIPHRTRLTQLIVENFKVQYENLHSEIQVSIDTHDYHLNSGRIDTLPEF